MEAIKKMKKHKLHLEVALLHHIDFDRKENKQPTQSSNPDIYWKTFSTAREATVEYLKNSYGIIKHTPGSLLYTNPRLHKKNEDMISYSLSSDDFFKNHSNKASSGDIIRTNIASIRICELQLQLQNQQQHHIPVKMNSIELKKKRKKDEDNCLEFNKLCTKMKKQDTEEFIEIIEKGRDQTEKVGIGEKNDTAVSSNEFPIQSISTHIDKNNCVQVNASSGNETIHLQNHSSLSKGENGENKEIDKGTIEEEDTVFEKSDSKVECGYEEQKDIFNSSERSSSFIDLNEVELVLHFYFPKSILKTESPKENIKLDSVSDDSHTALKGSKDNYESNKRNDSSQIRPNTYTQCPSCFNSIDIFQSSGTEQKSGTGTLISPEAIQNPEKIPMQYIPTLYCHTHIGGSSSKVFESNSNPIKTSNVSDQKKQLFSSTISSSFSETERRELFKNKSNIELDSSIQNSNISNSINIPKKMAVQECGNSKFGNENKNSYCFDESTPK